MKRSQRQGSTRASCGCSTGRSPISRRSSAEQDVVYVGGGNTVSLLAVWRAHGVDRALRDAYDGGVVLAGMSAGANCWFEACTTDSFQLGRADPLADGLGFVPGSFTPHYDSEPARRPAVLELVASGALPPGFACDDYAAVHLVDGALREALAITARGSGAPRGTGRRRDPRGFAGRRADGRMTANTRPGRTG